MSRRHSHAFAVHKLLRRSPRLRGRAQHQPKFHREELALPDCDAWIVHVPAATIVSVLPETAQTGDASDAKLTARPDEAVGFTTNGATPYVLLLFAGNIMGLVVERRRGREKYMRRTKHQASGQNQHDELVTCFHLLLRSRGLRFSMSKCWAACIGDCSDNQDAIRTPVGMVRCLLGGACVDRVYTRSEAVSHLIDSTSLYASCLGLTAGCEAGNLQLSWTLFTE
jgi:hypothetical protein